MSTALKTSPEIRNVVNAALSSGNWSLEKGSKHPKIRHSSGRMVTFAVSSSDRMAAKFLERDIRRVEQGIPGRGENKEVMHVVNLGGKVDNGKHHFSKGHNDGKATRIHAR